VLYKKGGHIVISWANPWSIVNRIVMSEAQLSK